MKITRNKKLVPDQMLDSLLREFERGTKINEGGLTFERNDFRELYAILPDAFTVNPDMRHAESIRIFSSSLLECRLQGTINSDAIIAQAIKIYRTSIGKPQDVYTMWMKFRARDMPMNNGFKFSWRGVNIRSAANLPSWLQRGDYFVNGVGRISPKEPSSFGHAIINCKERSEERAVERMSEAFQLTLGLLNLYETRGRRTFFTGRNWTQGKLWFGPTQFVYQKRKFLGEDRIWYNPDHDDETWERHAPSIKRILPFVPRARAALAALDKHPLCNILARAIILMQEGFATRDDNYRLLRYWSALEQLYVESDNKIRSNEKLIERALFAEIEPNLAKWKLEHIARIRNDYVHAGVSGGDAQNLSQFLCELLSRHLNYWIFRGHDLENHAALLQFVKLPSDRTTLGQMRNLIDRRLSLFKSLGE